MLIIKDLHVSVDGRKVLNGLSLTVKSGELHAIMGPNGAGKSTLSKVLAGHPHYHVESGEILYEINFELKNLLDLEPDDRAREGVFLAFQYPVEVPGISNLNFLRASLNSILEHQGSEPLSEGDFEQYLEKKLQIVSMKRDFLERSVNVGFSGGEKKRNEILQMAVLSPRLALLDETDSGLDIDALRSVAEAINKMRSPERSFLMVTHYQRLLEYIKPDFVHILVAGRIVRSGDMSLALKLEKQGYDGLGVL